jgi:hypothetical protein
MLDSRVLLEPRDPDAKAKKKGEPKDKELADEKGKSKAEKSGDGESRGVKVEKVAAMPAVGSKKSIIDLVNLSQEEPKSEVERMIQHKLLQKKLSGQGSSSSEHNMEGQPKRVNEVLVSESDILNQFRGVEMEDGMEMDDNRPSASQKKPPEAKNQSQTAEINIRKNYQDEFEAEDEAGDEGMMGIWGGPKEEEHRSIFIT